MLALLFITLGADEKHPVLNRDNLKKPTQMQLSQKQETSSQVLGEFSKSRLNYQDFQKKFPS